MTYDVAVIGAGPGGYVAAIRAAQLGLKTVCIEKGKTLGGTCLNVGCIPSKALLQSSEQYEWFANQAPDHGIASKGLTVDFKQMMDRKGEVVDNLVQGVAGLFKRNQITRIEGEAQLISPTQIKIGNEQIEAKNIILATGSEPIELPFMPFDEKVIISSTGALILPKIPKKMILIGAGVIGVELASVYRRLGTKVTIIEMLDRVCPGMDLAVSRALYKIFKKQGLIFHLSAQVTAAEVSKNKVTVTFTQKDESQTIEADVVLVGVGRRPYSKGLNLEKLDIALDSKGLVSVNGNFQTIHSNIYAIGDLIEGPMLAHRASEEGVAVAEIIAGKTPHVNYMAIPNVIYTHPEVASLGLTEEEAKELGIEILTGTYQFRGNARARCAGDLEGFVKVIGDKKTHRLLGMHIVGPHASEMIGEGVIAMEKRATLEDIGHASQAHPTLSEAIKEAALAAFDKPIHA